MTNYKQVEIGNKDLYNKRFSVIESLLFVTGDPLKETEIMDILSLSLEEVEKTMDKLAKNYHSSDRGLKLIRLNNAYQLVTKTENSDFVQKLLKTNARHSLSQAALETLSIVAYKQPITRIDVDEIRGVKSDRAIVTLVERSLIKETGRKDVPGRPILYSTTEEFLRYFSLESLKELPALESFYNEEEDEATREENLDSTLEEIVALTTED